MAIAFDAVGPSSAGTGTANTTSITWNHTCTGSNLLLVVGVGVGSGLATTTTSVTYNSVSMTSAGKVYSDNQTDGYVELFYLAGPATGSNAVVVTCSVAKDLTGGSMSFTGVDQSTPVTNAVTAFGTGTAPSVTVTSASGNVVIDAAVSGSAFSSSGQTLRWNKNLNVTSGAGNSAQSTANGASSVTMSYTTPSDWWGIVGANIVAGATSTTPSVTTLSVSGIGITDATGNGSVDSDGGSTITERGVCWSTSLNPTTADSTATAAGTTGAYSASITGLTANALYHVRAYAINDNGTAYGSDTTFTTEYGANLAWLSV
ncbi:MAG TPA: hypothetical protein VLF60_02090 [Candidatus Saccharimonadales bacterium]|nr:hypothetical protein [Candidatus Saccharimonadales bacterium]